MQSQPTTKIRWEYKQGNLEHFFDDLLIAGSARLEEKYRNRIAGYRLEELVNFDTRLLMGWQTEVYNLNLNESYKNGEQVLYERVRQMCSAQLGGNVQRGLNISSEISNQTFKHIILPIWLSSYKYQDKIYRFLINGQTGKIYGDKPLSWIRIALLIILFAIFIFGIWYWKEMGGFQR